jgi:hypothetical protein
MCTSGRNVDYLHASLEGPGERNASSSSKAD